MNTMMQHDTNNMLPTTHQLILTTSFINHAHSRMFVVGMMLSFIPLMLVVAR